MDYFRLIEEAEFSSWHQSSNLGHWSPKLLPFPLYPEAYSDGMQFPAAVVLSVILSHVTFSQEDAIDERCTLLGPFLGEQNPPVPLSKAPGVGCLVLSLAETASQPFTWKDHSPCMHTVPTLRLLWGRACCDLCAGLGGYGPN